MIQNTECTESDKHEDMCVAHFQMPNKALMGSKVVGRMMYGKEVNHYWCRETAARYQSSSTSVVFSYTHITSLRNILPHFNFVYCSPQEGNEELITTNPPKAYLMWIPSH